jgi:hypothetical protein
MSQNGFQHDVETVVHRLCEDIATPRALTVSLLVRFGEWDQLASLKADPMKYNCPRRFKVDAAVTGILRKCQNLPTKVDRKAAAIANFWSGERDCTRTNLRLRPFLDGSYDLEDEGVFSFIERTRKIVADILGTCPDLIDGRHGPGSTFGDRGQLCTVPDKMSEHPTFTHGAWPFLFQWAGTQWASACCASSEFWDTGLGYVLVSDCLPTVQRDPKTVPGNRFTTVPKDSTKDRGIAIEPSVNLFYQLGYGDVLKRRLRSAGLDLQHAQETHRQIAREASIRGHFATLDLSNASDTISNSLVKLLLPKRWYECLTALRSPKTHIEGQWVWLEKFSSMGNGFTFELETLIFASLAKAAMESSDHLAVLGYDLHVYGDDIIVPTECAADVMAVLQYFGMTLNGTKSFVTGPFRESCGGDFFLGQNVRPYHLEELPYEPQHYIAMANGLRRMGLKDLYPDEAYDFVRRAWFSVLDAIPYDIRRCRGPSGLGDIVIHDSPDRWTTRWRDSIRYVRAYRPANHKKVKWEQFRPSVILACATYGQGDGQPSRKGRPAAAIQFDSGGVIPRDAVLGHKVAWVPYS